MSWRYYWGVSSPQIWFGLVNHLVLWQVVILHLVHALNGLSPLLDSINQSRLVLRIGCGGHW